VEEPLWKLTLRARTRAASSGTQRGQDRRSRPRSAWRWVKGGCCRDRSSARQCLQEHQRRCRSQLSLCSDDSAGPPAVTIARSRQQQLEPDGCAGLQVRSPAQHARLGRLGRVVLAELHGQREEAALPVGAFAARDAALPAHQVGAPAAPQLCCVLLQAHDRTCRAPAPPSPSAPASRALACTKYAPARVQTWRALFLV